MTLRILLLAGAMLAVGPATAVGQAVETVEAETLSVKGSAGEVIDDPTASRGRAIRLHSAGRAEGDVTTKAHGRLTLRVRGERCEGLVEFRVKVDGRKVIDATAPHTAWGKLSANFTIPAGTHNVSIIYGPDDTGTGCDRALRVDKLFFEEASVRARPEAQLDLDVEAAGVLAETYYPTLSNEPLNTCAVGNNALWERGERDRWQISLQNKGQDYIVAGLIRDDPGLIENGLCIFEWGFQYQSPYGGFKSSSNESHALNFFIEGVARSLLLLEHSPLGLPFADRVTDQKMDILRAAKWMTSDDFWPVSKRRDAPYNHTHYLLSAGLGMTAKVANNKTLKPFAQERLGEGMALQHPDGWNPELGGWDSGYQAIGLQYAQRWPVYLSDFPGSAGIDEVIDRGIAWEASRIGPDGRVATAGNTRTCVDMDGKIKVPGYRHVIHILDYWGQLKDRPELVDLAWQVEDYRRSRGPLCDDPPPG